MLPARVSQGCVPAWGLRVRTVGVSAAALRGSAGLVAVRRGEGAAKVLLRLHDGRAEALSLARQGCARGGSRAALRRCCRGPRSRSRAWR